MGETKVIRIPLKLHAHVLHMAEMYEDLCVTHGIENVMTMTSYVEDRLSTGINRLRED